MKLTDALSNWLSIKKVYDERPYDLAAKDTFEFFGDILKEDHHVEIRSVDMQGPFYILAFTKNGEEQTEKFFVDAIDSLFEGIQNEPRFNEGR
jgi:hypothetical protein